MNRLLTLTLLTMSICTLPNLIAQNSNAFPVQVKTSYGVIEGNYDTHSGIQSYLGVPFAKPPVGALRWKAPVPLESWEGVKQTKAFGPRPMQTLVFGDMKSRSAGVSEDCLYLNVWTPAQRNTKDLPVLVYYYGGGFVAGDASEYRYDGASMAALDIVVVTVNYRLNVFGFLAHPELSEETTYGGSGNYGLLDQVAALQWVHDNIAAFGGDPDKITIAGESAGSISVSLLMASPLSKDLIAGAIGESGASIHPTLPPRSLNEAEQEGRDFLEKSGVGSIAELRTLSTRDIYELYNESGRFGFPISIDGYFLPAPLPEIFTSGKQAKVPLLLGWNSAEIPGAAFMQGQTCTPENYRKVLMQTYPEDHDEALALYPGNTDQECIESATALASDRFIAYSTWKWFDLQRRHSDQPVYRYLYSKLRPPLRDQDLVPGLAGGTMQRSDDDPKPLPAIGAPHACEIEYCLGNLHLVDDYLWTAADYKVSATMQTYFANFIKAGNPNAADLPNWPAVPPEDATPSVMILDTESSAKEAQHDDRYRWLDQQYQDP